MSDLISRQAAMDICDTFNGQGSVWAVIKGYIKALPPVDAPDNNVGRSDCISRQAAIDACLNGWNKDYKEIVADIKALPPVEQKQGWIPVSERLPEEEGLYLVYTKEQPYVCLFDGREWYIDEVIAWMPLPKPYNASPIGEDVDE